jgi:hypothetical protein
MLENLLQLVKVANDYGFPLPVIVVIFFLYKIIISKINWWTKRENYYKITLTNLGNWREGLSTGLDWFIEPGSEYNNDFHKSRSYTIYYEYSIPAQKALKENMHFGRLFLSEDSVKSIDELFNMEWYLANIDSSCTKEYLEKTLAAVESTYHSILKDAAIDLKNSNKREFLAGILNRS